ncbi:2-oxo-tetronate isomerase [Spiribacter vilamensis]|uniref:Hydroxypyruvate isomerase n=1 Tax=Spiribacter vilamensis TaxID=531306 RepID=A0A4Q8CZ79_9GAMM|nr:2-oxo-tetronate isomerase [Spiribacter vilamensis]RZU98328.1 hydroxypyruvate isomerase [Spiribacter vilamensis]TVO60785.1 hydroxypyruvate isomerase family protein [Spiribacter vilamensis]
MIRLAANLSMMFTEYPFMDRFAAAADAGFRGVEYLFPYEYSASDIAEALAANGLEQVLFNLPPGDWDAGERGVACLPGRETEFREGVETALRYAEKLECRQLHMMAGIAPPRTDPARVEMTYLSNLHYAAAQAEARGIKILIEPINPTDMPGYFLRSAGYAHELIQRVQAVTGDNGARNIAIQLDLYHRQMLEGRLAVAIDEYLGESAHIQIAGVPGRHEPDADGEVNWDWVLGTLDRLGYDGWIGCEYRPRGRTDAGIVWANPWLASMESRS